MFFYCCWCFDGDYFEGVFVYFLFLLLFWFCCHWWESKMIVFLLLFVMLNMTKRRIYFLSVFVFYLLSVNGRPTWSILSIFRPDLITYCRIFGLLMIIFVMKDVRSDKESIWSKNLQGRLFFGWRLQDGFFGIYENDVVMSHVMMERIYWYISLLYPVCYLFWMWWPILFYFLSILFWPVFILIWKSLNVLTKPPLMDLHQIFLIYYDLPCYCSKEI